MSTRILFPQCENCGETLQSDPPGVISMHVCQTRGPAKPRYQPLTPAEARTLAVVATTHSDGAAALALGVQPATVRNRLSSIVAKLRVKDRREAVAVWHGEPVPLHFLSPVENALASVGFAAAALRDAAA